MPATNDDILRELQSMNKNSSDLNSAIAKLLGSKSLSKTDKNDFGYNKTSKDEGNTIFDGLINKAGKPLEGITKQLDRFVELGINQISDYDRSRVVDVSKSLNFISNLVSKNPLSALGDIVEQIGFQLEDEYRLRTKINEETGLTGELSEDIRNSIVNSIPSTLMMGYGIERMGEFYTKMVEQAGKFRMVNQEILARTAEVTRAFTGDLTKTAEYITTYENVGIGMSDTLESINKIGVKSLELGLRSKKTVNDVATNLDKLNAFGFKNGVDGLAKMSRLATEFRMNMGETFKIAEKVFSPEGAIELSANLSIIGGQLGAFNDPLKLMYMATNNVEGLQTALIDAAKGLATYNTEQGRFEITGINLRKARAMAEQLGVDYNELAKGAIAAAERTQAATALMSTGLQMNDEDREFITNLSQMEKGEMVIKIPESLSAKLTKEMGQKIETAIPLSQMTESLKNELIKNKDAFAKMDAKEISMKQLSLQEQINRNVMSIAAVAKVRITDMLKNAATGDVEGTAELLAVKFGKSIEDFTEIDKKTGKLKFLSGAENLIGEIKKDLGLTTTRDQATKRVEDYLKAKEQEKTVNTEKTIIENKFTYSSIPSWMDGWQREMMKNPQTWQDVNERFYNDVKDFTYSGRGF